MKTHCPYHGKTLCDECAGMDNYGPTMYTAHKAWDESGKADMRGMCMYFINELAREKRETKRLREQVKDLLHETKRLREQVKDLLQMQTQEGVSK